MVHQQREPDFTRNQLQIPPQMTTNITTPLRYFGRKRPDHIHGVAQHFEKFLATLTSSARRLTSRHLHADSAYIILQSLIDLVLLLFLATRLCCTNGLDSLALSLRSIYVM
jgi:hypothetical protein